MKIVIIPLGHLPPDATDGEEITVAEDCYLQLIEAARRHLPPDRYVAGVWDRRAVDGRFWVAWSKRNPLAKVPARKARCRRQ